MLIPTWSEIRTLLARLPRGRRYQACRSGVTWLEVELGRGTDRRTELRARGLIVRLLAAADAFDIAGSDPC